MSRARDRKKAIDLSTAADSGREHRPRCPRPHLAQEFRENAQHDLAEQMMRPLRPWAAESALGMTAQRYAREVGVG